MFIGSAHCHDRVVIDLFRFRCLRLDLSRRREEHEHNTSIGPEETKGIKTQDKDELNRKTKN